MLKIGDCINVFGDLCPNPEYWLLIGSRRCIGDMEILESKGKPWEEEEEDLIQTVSDLNLRTDQGFFFFLFQSVPVESFGAKV